MKDNVTRLPYELVFNRNSLILKYITQHKDATLAADSELCYLLFIAYW